jgi:hypothetical protein
MNAQVFEQATVAWIKTDPDGGADPFLCVFGNKIEDVILIDYLLDFDGKKVEYLREREEVFLSQYFTREMERLNVRFLNIHIVQRKLSEVNGKMDVITYFFVDIVERVGGKYYIVATNNWN